ncbi:MAG: hypothetical protein K940chlam1_00686 [Candidatus Anoxychlamydiales bacterium]|nr:hypothetical protein [Candidatus Anoxychlamydiales bacterium]NGX36330.1 hypothetical protein [Candidatus Anoxychlamydiales bacterium]
MYIHIYKHPLAITCIGKSMATAITKTGRSSSDSHWREIEKLETEDGERIRVQLPFKSGKYSTQARNFDNLQKIDYSKFGIQLEEVKTEDSEEDNNLVWAILPSNWSVEDDVKNDDFHFFIILDSNRDPKLRVLLRKNSSEGSAFVMQISILEVKSLKKQIRNKNEFQALLKRYNDILKIESDSKLVKSEKEKAFKDLETFTKKHPIFACDLPEAKEMV